MPLYVDLDVVSGSVAVSPSPFTVIGEARWTSEEWNPRAVNASEEKEHTSGRGGYYETNNHQSRAVGGWITIITQGQ